MKRILDDARALGIEMDEGRAELLRRYTDLLSERGSALGVISEADRGRPYERHVLDCLRGARAFGASDRLACDLGSGGGLPGLVLALAVPWCRFLLVEPRRRRVAFLELAVERLALGNAEIAVSRAEDLAVAADVCTARALASLPAAWRLAVPLLRPGGRLVYWAGRSLRDPLLAAQAATEPESPARVELLDVLATEPPLVMMFRT